MADKLPPIYLKLFSGKLDFCDEEDPEFVVAYPCEADAIVEHCGGPVVKYIPAHNGCADCKIKPANGDNYPESCGECRWFYADLRVAK